MSELKSKPTAAQTANNWGSRNHIHTLVLIAVTVVAIYFSYLLAVPFLPALAWALALAILFAPLYRWLESKVKHPNLAATVSVFIVVVIVVVPLAFVAERIVAAAHPVGRGRSRRDRQFIVSHVGGKTLENAHRPRVYFYRRRANCFRCVGPDSGPVIFTVARFLLEIWSSQSAAEQAKDQFG